MKKSLFFAAAVILFFYFTGCGGKNVAPKDRQVRKLPVVSMSGAQIKKRLMTEFGKWKGTPHVMGGNTRKGVDCSGFIHQIFRQVFGLNVPRSTKLLMTAGTPIRKADMKPGDIVLFRPPSYPRHVGIYVGSNRFIHTSKSKGVTITSLSDSYWKKCYHSSRRLFTGS